MMKVINVFSLTRVCPLPGCKIRPFSQFPDKRGLRKLTVFQCDDGQNFTIVVTVIKIRKKTLRNTYDGAILGTMF